MAIYSNDEFDRIRCPECGHEVFYTKEFVSLKKEKIKPNNFTKHDIVECKDTAVKIHYCCAHCNNIVAVYYPNDKVNKWHFVE